MKKFFYALIFGAAAFCITLNLTANRFIFFPKAEYLEHQLPFEEITFTAADGAVIHGLYYPPADFMDTVLFFPGNAGNSSYFEEFGAAYTRHGYGFLIFDYRGFGRSEGTISETNIYADARAAVEYLIKERKTAPGNIILFGYSLGNAPAIKMAVEYKDAGFKALVLQSPFTNIPQMGAALLAGGYDPSATLQKAVIGVLYVALFNKRFDNLSRIGRVKLPMIIGYSKQDALIPWQMSAALAAAAPEGVQTFLSPYGHHTDYAWFEKPVVKFINSLK